MLKLDLIITNETSFNIPSKQEIEEAILNVLNEKDINGNIEVGLKVVDKNEIRRLNRAYRKIDAPTDVLSFPIYNTLPEYLDNDQPILLGDIVICEEVLLKNAEEYKETPENEFKKLVAHSTLHLLVFHHRGD